MRRTLTTAIFNHERTGRSVKRVTFPYCIRHSPRARSGSPFKSVRSTVNFADCVDIISSMALMRAVRTLSSISVAKIFIKPKHTPCQSKVFQSSLSTFGPQIESSCDPISTSRNRVWCNLFHSGIFPCHAVSFVRNASTSDSQVNQGICVE